MFHLPSDDVISLQAERQKIWELFETGQLDDHEATVRLLRVGLALRRLQANFQGQPLQSSRLLFG